jgi:hypothetical protein
MIDVKEEIKKNEKEAAIVVDILWGYLDSLCNPKGFGKKEETKKEAKEEENDND